MPTLLKDRMGAIRHDHTKNPKDGRKKYRLWSVRRHDEWTQAGPATRLDAYAEYHRHRRAEAIRAEFIEAEEGTEEAF